MLLTLDLRRALLRALFFPAVGSVVVLFAVALTVFLWLVIRVGWA